MKTSGLLEAHSETWQMATRHPFLDAVRDGTIATGAFETWLVQDYLFAADLLAFQTRLLARSPRRDQALLVGGLVALEAEMTWFEQKAEERSLGLDAARHPENAAYGDFLTSLERGEPYPAAITALWALERAYLEAWRSAAPGHTGYQEFVEHWTTTEFAGYVASLQTAADAALDEVTSAEWERAGAAFLEVARLEKGFWDIALPGDEQ